MAKLTIPKEELMMPGHVGCLGCGATLTMRYVLKALGRKTMVAIPACCWAVMPGVFPYTCLKIPMLYNAFETTAASITGLKAALSIKGKEDITVVGFAGDGGTADIGIQALSGAVERGEDVIYVMYDNEAYMNTGIQRSSATPVGAWTTTTSVGKTGDWKKRPKKNMVEIMIAHGIPYTATAAICYPEDLIRKVKKAKDIRGTKFLHIYSPCPTGWKYPPEKTVEIARLAVATHIFPLFEFEDGKYAISKKPKRKEVREYLLMQGRFRHLPDEIIEQIQEQVDRDWELLLKKEEFTKNL